MGVWEKTSRKQHNQTHGQKQLLLVIIDNEKNEKQHIQLLIYSIFCKQFIQQDMQEKTEQVLKADSLVCPRLHTAKMMCGSPTCQKSSFMCLDQQCQVCANAHQQCQIYKLSKVVTKLNSKKQKITPQIEKTIETMERIYDEAIQKLSICKQYARGQMQMFGYYEGELQFITKISDGLINQIDGKITSQVIKTLNLELQFNANQQLIQGYWQKKKSQFEKIFQTFKALPNCQLSNLDSVIVKEPEEIEWIKSNFQGQLALNYKKLFRASQNNFSAAKFHLVCDGKSNTLTLARTNHGRVIGAFTPIAWNSSSNYMNDLSCSNMQKDGLKSFLFSVSLKQKYPCIDGSNAVYGNSGYGPTFGSGHDFYIADMANNNTNSYFNFPYSYNSEDRKYVNGAQSYTSFSGSPDGEYSARIQQWEVYQIEFA